MGYRTVVVLNNDEAHNWGKDPELGSKILAASHRTGVFTGGKVVECVHADEQSLVVLDSLSSYCLATSHWNMGEDQVDVQLKLLEQAAADFGFELRRKC